MPDRQALTSTALRFATLWDCTRDGDAFSTLAGLVWPVERAGQKLMLKVVNSDDDEVHAAEILRYFDGNGAIRLIESEENVLLAERAVNSSNQPTLEKMVLEGQDDAATTIICDVIARLHFARPGSERPAHLIPFGQRSDDMHKHMGEGRVALGDRPMVQLACDLSEDLMVETNDAETPLHGDIHHFNVLWDDHRGWLAIDPKGILGPRVYEYANALCNPCLRKSIVADSKRMGRQASIIAERADLDTKMLLKYSFLHATQVAAWSLSQPDQEYWLACGRTAARLAGVSIE